MSKRIYRLVPIFLTSFVLLAFARQAYAEELSDDGKTCYVSKFKFENEGGYELSMFRVDSHTYSGHLSQGQARTWDIDKSGVAEGDEVFLTYRIDKGDGYCRLSCEKDDTVLRYHPDGNTWGYWSKGTTTINNRCRFRSNKCIDSVD